LSYIYFQKNGKGLKNQHFSVLILCLVYLYHTLHSLARIYLRPRLHETGTKSNLNENWNCQHVHMRPVRKWQNFRFIPLARQSSFQKMDFVGMCCSNVNQVTAETALKCICVYIHPSLNSCRSEVSRLGPAGGMTWDWSELFSSRSHVIIYYKLYYDRNEMVPVWLRSGLM
jgi:hypothetical protein